MRGTGGTCVGVSLVIVLLSRSGQPFTLLAVVVSSFLPVCAWLFGVWLVLWWLADVQFASCWAGGVPVGVRAVGGLWGWCPVGWVVSGGGVPSLCSSGHVLCLCLVVHLVAAPYSEQSRCVLV